MLFSFQRPQPSRAGPPSTVVRGEKKPLRREAPERPPGGIAGHPLAGAGDGDARVLSEVEDFSPVVARGEIHAVADHGMADGHEMRRTGLPDGGHAAYALGAEELRDALGKPRSFDRHVRVTVNCAP